jgi:hypothetical protein
MAVRREGHMATLLMNGQVLIFGGNTSGEATVNSAELFTPATGTFSNTGSMSQTRVNHQAALLPDGQVLVFGGNTGGTVFDSAELYNPVSGTWTNTSSMADPRSQNTATLLLNGDVLAVGTASAGVSCELYGPSIHVQIDIKPGAFPNRITLSGAGAIPVAIFSSPTFDAPAEVDPDSLTLDGAKVRVVGRSDKSLCHSEDVNNDGLLDLVCQFENDLNAQVGDTIAILEGETYIGIPIRGQDSISIVSGN